MGIYVHCSVAVCAAGAQLQTSYTTLIFLKAQNENPTFTTA
jgi:hypothetical protein